MWQHCFKLERHSPTMNVSNFMFLFSKFIGKVSTGSYCSCLNSAVRYYSSSVTIKMSKVPLVTFNNGKHIPQFGLGTWKVC